MSDSFIQIIIRWQEYFHWSKLICSSISLLWPDLGPKFLFKTKIFSWTSLYFSFLKWSQVIKNTCQNLWNANLLWQYKNITMVQQNNSTLPKPFLISRFSNLYLLKRNWTSRLNLQNKVGGLAPTTLQGTKSNRTNW